MLTSFRTDRSCCNVNQIVVFKDQIENTEDQQQKKLSFTTLDLEVGTVLFFLYIVASFEVHVSRSQPIEVKQHSVHIPGEGSRGLAAGKGCSDILLLLLLLLLLLSPTAVASAKSLGDLTTLIPVLLSIHSNLLCKREKLTWSGANKCR